MHTSSQHGHFLRDQNAEIQDLNILNNVLIYQNAEIQDLKIINNVLIYQNALEI